MSVHSPMPTSPPLPIEIATHRAFDKLMVGDTPPISIDIIIPADAVPIA